MMRCILLILSSAIAQVSFWQALIIIGTIGTNPPLAIIIVAALAFGISIWLFIRAWRECREA